MIAADVDDDDEDEDDDGWGKKAARLIGGKGGRLMGGKASWKGSQEDPTRGVNDSGKLEVISPIGFVFLLDWSS